MSSAAQHSCEMLQNELSCVLFGRKEARSRSQCLKVEKRKNGMEQIVEKSKESKKQNQESLKYMFSFALLEMLSNTLRDQTNGPLLW